VQPIIRCCDFDPEGKFAAAHSAEVAQRRSGRRRRNPPALGNAVEECNLTRRRALLCGREKGGLIVVEADITSCLLRLFGERSDCLGSLDLLSGKTKVAGRLGVAAGIPATA
jgi:hypothetical protein